MNGSSSIVKIVAQAGLAGVAGFALYILWNVTANHVQHNTDALIEFTGVIREQSGVLQRLERVLDK